MGCADVTVTAVQGKGGRRPARQAKVTVLRYPDGGAWTEQEAVVSQVFGLIANEIQETARRGG